MHRCLLIALFLTGCVDAGTVCAAKLGIPQDDKNVYLSRVNEPERRAAFYQCVIRHR